MQHKKIYQLLASAALITALPLSALAQGKEPVKVGLVSSKSGVFAEQGEEVMRAVKLKLSKAMMKALQTQAAVSPKKWRVMGTTF